MQQVTNPAKAINTSTKQEPHYSPMNVQSVPKQWQAPQPTNKKQHHENLLKNGEPWAQIHVRSKPKRMEITIEGIPYLISSKSDEKVRSAFGSTKGNTNGTISAAKN